MSTGKFQSLLSRTLKVFLAEEKTTETREAPPSTGKEEKGDSHREFLSQQMSLLADLLNVNAEEVSIQHRPRKDGAVSTFFLVPIQEDDCHLDLAFSPDLTQVFLLRLETGSSISPSRLHTLLAGRGLACEEGTLGSILGAEGTPPKGKIAQGVAPLPGRDEQIHFPFYPDQAACAQTPPIFAHLASEPLTALPTSARAVWATPGQVLAEIQPAEPGIPGKDVFGRLLPALDGLAVGMEPGPGVQKSEDGQFLEAIAHGYVYIHQQILGIRDPLILTEDNLCAHFTAIPGWASSPPSGREILGLLSIRGVVHGLEEENCNRAAQAFQKPSTQPVHFRVAQGRPPVHGRDGVLLFDVDCSPKPGKFNDDGSIDFRETNFGLNVPAGIQLARLRPATEGLSGSTLFGEEIPAHSGTQKELAAGPNVEIIEGDNELIFRSLIDGRVSNQKGLLQVFETLHFTADIGYQTGNVDFSGDVVIGGSVLPGFSIKAEGSIAIQGQVEAGAYLEAEGDIIVCGGIVGEETRVVSDGAVTAKFIQDATVQAGGDLSVGSYIFNGQVRCTARVNVNQSSGRRSGSISGGQVVAARGIQASFAGSPNGTPTQLVIGIDPEVEESLRICQRQLARCEEAGERLRHQLGLEEVTLPGLKRLLHRASSTQHDQIILCIRQWQKLDKGIRAMRAKRASLQKGLTHPAPDALLTIAQTIFPGVRIQLGEQMAEIQLELRDTRLTRDTWAENLLLETAA